MLDRRADDCRADQHPDQSPQRLRDHVAQRIESFNLAEPEKRQGHRGIQMGAGLFSPGRIDQADCGEAHADPDQDASEQGIGDNDVERGVRIFEGGGDDRS